MIRHRQERLVFPVPHPTEGTSGCPGLTAPNKRKTQRNCIVLSVGGPEVKNSPPAIVGLIYWKRGRSLPATRPAHSDTLNIEQRKQQGILARFGYNVV